MAAAAAEELVTLRRNKAKMHETLSAITDGVQTWLMPTLARHSPAIARRHYAWVHSVVGAQKYKVRSMI
jgi:hypothetical protein